MTDKSQEYVTTELMPENAFLCSEVKGSMHNNLRKKLNMLPANEELNAMMLLSLDRQKTGP